MKRITKMTMRTRMMLVFLLTTIMLFAVDVFVYGSISKISAQIEDVYYSNVFLNDLKRSLDSVQSSMTEYLNTKSTESMGAYFDGEAELRVLADGLNQERVNDDMLMMEKNIYALTQSYLELTGDAIEQKRGRNIEKYKARYNEATQMYEYLNAYIYSLNTMQFEQNTSQYENVMWMYEYSGRINIIVLLAVGVFNIVFSLLITKSLTEPLYHLAQFADTVATGNLDVELLPEKRDDEVGVVTRAFNGMVVNLRTHIEKLKESLEKENEMKKHELLMESHLKDAQLKYLQAQINPHFLFNTLNAGAQLAMIEGADRTYTYIQNVADFFRYNVRKDDEPVSLAKEIELIDNYVYIINVRFAGEIHFSKQVDETFRNFLIPPMVLQPLVENAINYGVRGIDRKAMIELTVEQQEDTLCVSVWDNGVGMPRDVQERILRGEVVSKDDAQHSGVGLSNVISRLRLYYKKEDIIRITSEGEDLGTEITLLLPIEENYWA